MFVFYKTTFNLRNFVLLFILLHKVVTIRPDCGVNNINYLLGPKI